MVKAALTPAVLSDNWMPDRLLIRDKELNELSNLLKDGRNVFISGQKATGKSLTCKYFRNTYPENRVLYVKCTGGLRTNVRQAILSESSSVNPYIFPTVLEHYRIVILDDIHEVKDPHSLYWVKDLYDFFTEKKSVQVIITSIHSFHKWSKMDAPVPEIMSRYNFAYIGFAPYGYKETYTILLQRAMILFNVGELTQDQSLALSFIAEKSVRWSDLRIALRTLAYAYSKNELNLQRVKEGWMIEKKDYWQRELRNLSLAGVFLFVISWCALDLPQLLSTNPQQEIPLKVIRSKYEKVCKKWEVEPVQPYQISRVLAKLEDDMYITRRISGGQGRGKGKESYVTLAFDDPEVIVNSVKDLGGEFWGEILK